MAFCCKAGAIMENSSQCNTNFLKRQLLTNYLSQQSPSYARRYDVTNMVPENDKRDGNSQVTINTSSQISRQQLLENENNNQTSLEVVSLVMDPLILSLACQY